MKTLFVSPQVPWPLDVGSKVRVLNLLRSYRRIGEVTLVCLAQTDAESLHAVQVEQEVERVCAVPLARSDSAASSAGGKLWALRQAIHPTPRAVRYFRSEALAAKVDSLLSREQFDILHVERLYMIENVLATFRRRRGAPRPFRVLDLDDIESTRMKRKAAVEPWSSTAKYVTWLESLKFRASEQQYLPQFDCVLVCSERDRAFVQARQPRVALEVFANGADFSASMEPTPQPCDDLTLGFLGAMDYQPNEDAVLFFAEAVLPLLKRRVPDVRFVVAGKSPSARVRALDNWNGVRVIGYVDDKTALLSSYTVLVVPMRIGGGTRLKILEAMAAGTAVVSTTIGCEGIDVRPGEAILIADTPEDFAHACANLLRDPARRQAMALEGRAVVQKDYRWDEIQERYATAILDRVRRSIAEPSRTGSSG